MKPLHDVYGTKCHNCGMTFSVYYLDDCFCPKCKEQIKEIEKLEKEGK